MCRIGRLFNKLLVGIMQGRKGAARRGGCFDAASPQLEASAATATPEKLLKATVGTAQRAQAGVLWLPLTPPHSIAGAAPHLLRTPTSHLPTSRDND